MLPPIAGQCRDAPLRSGFSQISLVNLGAACILRAIPGSVVDFHLPMSTKMRGACFPVLSNLPIYLTAIAIASSWLFGVVTADAATLSWSGGGSSGNWSDTGNWGFSGPPATGDTLIFPAAQPRLANTNNIVGLSLNQIRFVGAGGGYAIFGNSITITNGIDRKSVV